MTPSPSKSIVTLAEFLASLLIKKDVSLVSISSDAEERILRILFNVDC